MGTPACIPAVNACGPGFSPSSPLLVSCRGSVPPVASEVYRQKALTHQDWGKVMAWANCMEAAFKTKVSSIIRA